MINTNTISSGIHIKAEICGVEKREFHSKKTGELFTFYTLIVETDKLRDKTRIQFDKKAIDSDLHVTFQKLVGKTLTIPIYLRTTDNYSNIHYRSELMPPELAQEHTVRASQDGSK